MNNLTKSNEQFNEITNNIIHNVNNLQEFFTKGLKEKQKYEQLINNLKEVVFQTDIQGLWTFLNRAWTEATGFEVNECLGQLCLNYVHPDDKELNQQKFTPLIERKEDCCRYEIRYITKNGGYKWIEVYARLALDENDNIVGTVGTLMDITERKLMELELKKHKENLQDIVAERTHELRKEIIERKKSEEKMKYYATHDSLTNIPNRYSLEKSLEEAITFANNCLGCEHCKETKGKCDKECKSVLLFIDIDNFKVINDTFGHSVGDKVLIKLVQLFKKYLRPTDILARLGGDEFAILLKQTDIEEAKEISEKLRKALDENDIKVNYSNICVNVTASIGAVPINGELDPQKLLAYADTALYGAKDNGKNRVAIIESFEDKTKLSQMNQTVNLIKKALKEDKFKLYFQPVYKIGNGITHYEALIRMIDDNNQLIPPGVFIPIAEKFGLMSQIDKWVIKSTIEQLKEHRDIKIFINISGISLGDKALLNFIESTIKESGIEPSRIGFEITETTAIADLVQSENWIKKLKSIGCRFALDDFGIGFSSFSYLNALPIDYLKIDGSFVKDLDTNPTQKALIQAMNAVAHALGKETIAEFVENEAILDILNELKVDHGQGYYLGKPGLLEKKED